MSKGETGDAPHGGAKPRAGEAQRGDLCRTARRHRQVRRLLFPVFPTRCASVTVRRCPGETDVLPATLFIFQRKELRHDAAVPLGQKRVLTPRIFPLLMVTLWKNCFQSDR